MAASLRAGLRHAPDADGVVVLLGDMPRVSPELMDHLIEAFEAGGAAAVVSTHGGRPGNPVPLGRVLFPLVARLAGDGGARDDIKELETDDAGVILDVDAAVDLSALNQH